MGKKVIETVELDSGRLSESQGRILMFESFLDCLDLFRPEIKRRFESIEGVVGCHVGYRARGFIVTIETKYPELRPTLIIEYKHIYLDLVGGPGRAIASPLASRLDREVARLMTQVEEAMRNMAT